METKYKNLVLEERVNKLDGLIINELFDINILDKLINSTLLLNTVNNPLCKYHGEKIQLTKYRELYIEEEGYSKVKLKRNIPYGRCNPEHSLSLFSIRRMIRHSLCYGIGDDIDIVNCHFVLF